MIIKSWQNYSIKIESAKDRETRQKDDRGPNDSLNQSCASEVDEAELVKLPVERKLQKRKGLLEGRHESETEPEFKVMPNTDDHYQF